LVVLPRSVMVSRAHQESSDDDYHLVRGLEFLRGDPGLVHRELNDPPLGQAIGALPLWLLGGDTHGKDEGTGLYGQRGYSPETATMLVAVWKSLLFLPFLALVFVWSRGLYGVAAGYFAVGLFALEPTIAAHVHLASLDVVATSGILLACWLGWRFFEQPTRGRFLLAGLGCALAMLLKHTAILVPVMFCGYAVLAWARGRHTVWKAGRQVRFVVAGAVLTVIVMLILLKVDASPVRKGRAWPGGIYIESIFDAAKHVREPNDAYLFGQVRRGGWWYYFPAVATYKAPLVVAAAMILAALSIFRRRLRWEEWSILLPMVGYFILMLLQSVNIGWRHFLPAYAFVLIFAARFLAEPGFGRIGRVAAGLVVLALAVENLIWFPDYIAYVNFPRRDVHLAISDSNVDWGQGLKQVREWVDAHPEVIRGRRVYLRPVATASRAVRYYLGDRVAHLRFSDEPPKHGILIISPVAVAGLSESKDEYAFLRGWTPLAVIGRVMRVYDLDAPGAAVH
jgi:4-amino-4-deoxy-L-arabinose transferase-like glycosyltransferase